MTTDISQAQWEQYNREGYLKLGRVLSDEDLATLQARIDAIMLGEAPVDYDRMLMQLDSESGEYGALGAQTKGHKGATLNYRKIQDLEFDPVFLAFMQRPVFVQACARVYGAHAAIASFRAMFMNKPAGKGTLLPWHQDGGDQWGLDRDPLLTAWTALDPSTRENGCVEVIPGSHHLGLLSERGHTLSPEHEKEHAPEEKAVALELEAGEVVLLHNWLLHRSGVNKSQNARRAFSVCYMDARTRPTNGDDTWPVVLGKGAMRVEDL